MNIARADDDMPRRRRGGGPVGLAAFALVLAGSLLVLAEVGARAAGKGDLKDFVGTWRGTSRCVNRTIAPACNDETIVYEVRASGKPQAAVLAADKIVDGRRMPMGELEFEYSDKEGCWRSELNTPRVHGVWCLVVEGSRLTGSLRLLSQNADVRKVEATRDPAEPPHPELGHPAGLPVAPGRSPSLGGQGGTS